jgi:hypothetical protein
VKSDRPETVSFASFNGGAAGPKHAAALRTEASSPIPIDMRPHISLEVTSDVTIAKVVFQLNTLAKAATFDFAMAVARIVIREFYAGDLSVWRKRGHKDVSFRALADHPQLSMSASALYRSVAMYELCDRLQISDRNHLSTSHLRLVLPLPQEEQARLLQEAESKHWSVRHLEGEISMLVSRRVRHQRGGRKPRSHVKATIESLAACLHGCDLDRAVDIEDTPESVEALLDMLDRVRDACAVLEHRITQRLPGARTDPPPKG